MGACSMSRTSSSGLPSLCKVFHGEVGKRERAGGSLSQTSSSSLKAWKEAEDEIKRPDVFLSPLGPQAPEEKQHGLRPLVPALES